MSLPSATRRQTQTIGMASHMRRPSLGPPGTTRARSSSGICNGSEPRHDQEQKQQRNQVSGSRDREQQRVAVGGLKYSSGCDRKEHSSDRARRSADPYNRCYSLLREEIGGNGKKVRRKSLMRRCSDTQQRDGGPQGRQAVGKQNRHGETSTQ